MTDFDYRRARESILRYEPASHRAGITSDPVARTTIGFGFSLDRLDAPAMLRAVGLDFYAVRRQHQPMSSDQMEALFDLDLVATVERVRVRLAHFDELPAAHQEALIEVFMWIGPELSDQALGAIERGTWPPPGEELQAAEWYDRLPPAKSFGSTRRATDLVKGSKVTPARKEVVGAWAIEFTRAKLQAQQRYESGTGEPFTGLPDDARTAIAFVTRDCEGGPPEFWRAVVEHRWEDALDELGDTGSRPSLHEHAARLLRQAVQEGLLPGPGC